MLDLFLEKTKLVFYIADHGYFTAAHENEDGEFIWPNGTTNEFSNFENWDDTQPDNWGGISEKCMALWEDSHHYQWHDVPCDTKLPFICERPYCSKDESNFACFEGKSYSVDTTEGSWDNATQICSKYNGSLLVINNERINNFIVTLLDENGELNYHRTKLNTIVAYLFQDSEFFGRVLQFFAVHSQLIIIIGLCMDSGQSLTSRFLKTKIMQFLGRISLSLYLLHVPIIGYIILAINGKQPYDTGDADAIWAAYDQGKIYVPPYHPFIVIVTSSIIAYIITKYFEEPISNLLKGKS